MAEHHVEVIEQLCSYADRHAEEHRALTRESATTGGEVA